MNTNILALITLMGCSSKQATEMQNVESLVPAEQSVDTETIPADYAVRVREASPDQSFYGQPAMIGSSADGFDRYLVHFPLEKLNANTSISRANLYFDALSGTCASSYDNTKCDLEITVMAYPVTSAWDPSVTWNTQPSQTSIAYSSSSFHVPYQGKDEVKMSVSQYVKQTLDSMRVNGNNGIVLEVLNDTNTTRQEQTLLHDGFHIGRAIQRDVLVGNPRLEVVYK